MAKRVKTSEKRIKLNEKDFIKNLAADNGLSANELAFYSKVLTEGIVDACEKGFAVSLTGFGIFCIKKHKGHPVQFEANNGIVSDYPVFKFSASDVLNRSVREDYVNGKVKIK